MREFPQVSERPPGISSTNVTNELARAVQAMAPVILGGQVPQPRVGQCVAVWVKVTGDATGGGKYNGRIVTRGAAAPNLSSNLSEADLGTLPSNDNCYVFNAAEVGKTTHDLTAGTPVARMFPGIYTGYAHTDGRPFIRISGYDWVECA